MVRSTPVAARTRVKKRIEKIIIIIKNTHHHFPLSVPGRLVVKRLDYTLAFETNAATSRAAPLRSKRACQFLFAVTAHQLHHLAGARILGQCLYG